MLCGEDHGDTQAFLETYQDLQAHHVSMGDQEVQKPFGAPF
jgi:hypothetical protein